MRNWTLWIELAQQFKTIYQGFRQCVKLRQKYMRLSYQRPGDNPKDLDTFEAYPVPYGVGRLQFSSGNYSRLNLSPGEYDETPQPLHIDMNRIPTKFPGCFRLNDEGIFEYFVDETGSS